MGPKRSRSSAGLACRAATTDKCCSSRTTRRLVGIEPPRCATTRGAAIVVTFASPRVWTDARHARQARTSPQHQAGADGREGGRGERWLPEHFRVRGRRGRCVGVHAVAEEVCLDPGSERTPGNDASEKTAPIMARRRWRDPAWVSTSSLGTEPSEASLFPSARGARPPPGHPEGDSSSTLNSLRHVAPSHVHGPNTRRTHPGELPLYADGARPCG